MTDREVQELIDDLESDMGKVSVSQMTILELATDLREARERLKVLIRQHAGRP